MCLRLCAEVIREGEIAEHEMRHPAHLDHLGTEFEQYSGLSFVIGVIIITYAQQSGVTE